MNVYSFKVKNIEGMEVSLEEYKGKALLIVNTASKCGFTPQFEGLQNLYEKYKDKGLEILGFPSNQFADQEPLNGGEVKNFCMVNYGVDFPLFEKIDVRGDNADPLFNYLTQQAPFKGFDMSRESDKGLVSFIKEKFPELLDGDSIKWNFTKFLVDKEGNVISRFEPPVTPSDLETDIEKLL
ncbi:MAG: glutathione peroxidase [Clostridiaceae bacterium]